MDFMMGRVGFKRNNVMDRAERASCCHLFEPAKVLGALGQL